MIQGVLFKKSDILKIFNKRWFVVESHREDDGRVVWYTNKGEEERNGKPERGYFNITSIVHIRPSTMREFNRKVC